ncbi:glycoside hydrolase family 15 protein [Granulicella mallensis]|uniref:Glucoamylase n=1 Tax=Granulicella mallensis TaxID=940614 RepID=A0A7W7ZPC4_9BACT|nr:glycoside hydrolase family 15 protein [Granulicella mallensis]MBB5063685.1 glucoamylase [Granulicella mallensis]
MQEVAGKEAFGKPGIKPRWTRSNKAGIGNAYSASSHLWFTIWNGIVTETYYPTVDRPQLRDLQYLVTDGKTFFHEEKRDLTVRMERISDHVLGYRCTNADADGRYTITKEIIGDPHLPCLLQRTRVNGQDKTFLANLRIFALCAPHLEVGGAGNNGYIAFANGQRILMARKGNTWMAMGATVPFTHLSCGYVGASDGWTDLHDNYKMDWEFDRASDGNIALTAEVDLGKTQEFTLGLAFGNSEHRAVANLLQSLGIPFDDHLARYRKQWDETALHLRSLQSTSFDKGNLYNSSYSLLLAHEDKSFAGALIAALAIPWGEAKGDHDEGGYHLVWTRDMVHSATALLAAGDTATPLRALIYLAVAQLSDGGFPQNFWVNGDAYWNGVQLDEVAFPIILAWHLRGEDGLADFDPFNMVSKAAAYLIRNGPVTQQERWEEASGYSPSTLAANVAALVCASKFFRERGDEETATFVEEYADYLELHIEDWTATATGSLVEGTSSYYMRILPEQVGQKHPAEDKESRGLHIANHASGEQSDFPARNVVDGGFLELVRYGIRSPDDPTVLATLKVIDTVLKTDTPAGPTWHRYNHDGYGQQQDGSPFTQHGVGRVWPLLSGERGHYELAAGRSTETYIRTMEDLASKTGLLPEQSWDQPDRPEIYMWLGRPTGSAMPLMWAHAEYIKLLRSTADGKVYDTIPEVAERYLGTRGKRKQLEVWKPSRHVRFMRPGEVLRVLGDIAFTLHWSSDNWETTRNTQSAKNALQIDYVDLQDVTTSSGVCIRFTFLWAENNHWEGQDYAVTVQ